MATAVADMSMSLDGFVADPHDGVDRVFAWYSKPQVVSYILLSSREDRAGRTVRLRYSAAGCSGLTWKGTWVSSGARSWARQ